MAPVSSQAVIRRGRLGEIAFREAGDVREAAGQQVLCLHGFPTSSALWAPTLRELARRGHRATAPDLPGFGDSEPLRPGTWERHVEAVEALRRGLDLGPVVLCVHDWGGLIGLRWACDHPEAVSALAITDTGFFADGRWHDMARTLRTEDEGERMLEQLTRESFDAMLRSVSAGIPPEAREEYWQALSTPERRQAALELYRSGDFAKLRPYEGGLGALGVPTLVLWGARDEFAPVGAGHRFATQIPGARLEILEGAGHFLHHDEPDRVAQAIASFVSELPPTSV